MNTKMRVMPSPGISPDNEAFIAAAREGRFVLRGCDDCGKTHWYPRAVCPHCWSSKTQWKPASGRGTVYSFSTMQRVDPPYTLAYVTLDEGPTMLTNLVSAAPQAWRIGMKVRVQFQSSDDGTPVAVFAPA
ncbi:MAG TPA: OB-fold domain-containing protein [Burkholderiaceae bacterium]|nr:OB-fold domain-containing protein [Burkholderiaceae bacterium]